MKYEKYNLHIGGLNMKLLIAIILIAMIKVMDHECNETNSEYVGLEGEAL